MKKGLFIGGVVIAALLIILIARSCSSFCGCGTVTKKESLGFSGGDLRVTLDNTYTYAVSKSDFEQAKVGQEWCFNY